MQLLLFFPQKYLGKEANNIMEVLFGIQRTAQTNLSYKLINFAQHLKRKERRQVAKLLGSMYKLDFFHAYFIAM